jgi:hypothetical protein
MATLYFTRDVKHGRHVTLEVLHPSWSCLREMWPTPASEASKTVSGFWSEAASPLQPVVKEAQAGLQRLPGGRAH